MKTYIHHIETLVPPFTYRQDYARDRMMEWLPGKKARRLIRGIYDRSGIETRFSVLPDFAPEADPVMFHRDASGCMAEPSTEARNRHFSEWSGDMSVEVSRKALAHDHGFAPEDVTHVITVSCTGFYNPGPDYEIVRGLGLSDSVERYHLGFMGCYAAFPALRMARQFCRARPEAVVLVVCLELCTLHLQLSEEPDSLLANALFADGAAAALVSARSPAEERPALELCTFCSALAPEGAADMAWAIGDHGFNIRLSTYVPDVIAGNVASITDRMLADTTWAREEIGNWAIHPGGRAILDKVEKEMGLVPAQVSDAREVLRAFGNMSSVTILFVLQRLLARSSPYTDRPLCAMAFGPGLTIETALMRQVTSTRPRPEEESHVQRAAV